MKQTRYTVQAVNEAGETVAVVNLNEKLDAIEVMAELVQREGIDEAEVICNADRETIAATGGE